MFNTFISLAVVVMLIMLPNISIVAIKTSTKEYTYQANEFNSKFTCAPNPPLTITLLFITELVLYRNI